MLFTKGDPMGPLLETPRALRNGKSIYSHIEIGLRLRQKMPRNNTTRYSEVNHE